jgi:predicted ATPase
MGTPLKMLTIRGFKSIERLDDFPLGKLNVLIGANGAGKSNFVEFFAMLRALADESLQKFVNQRGGGDGFLFLGPKITSRIQADLAFGENGYEFSLQPTADNRLIFADERIKYEGSPPYTRSVDRSIGGGHSESKLKEKIKHDTRDTAICKHIYAALSSWTVYHVHDTSMLAPMRRDQSVRDWARFRPDASNIAAFLLNLKEDEPGNFELIRDTVRLIAPFFDDFLLRPLQRGNDELVRLEWQQKGSDFPFQPAHLSDGTIRFICLATALLQPAPPATIVIDEPELGLHPYAISILADLIKSAAERTQVVISTQSPTLLDFFEPEEIVTVNRDQGRSTFERLDALRMRCNHFASWLERLEHLGGQTN